MKFVSSTVVEVNANRNVMIVIALLVTVVALIAVWLKKRTSYWKDRGFMYVKLDSPFGCLKGVGTQVHISERLTDYYRQFKDKAKAVGVYFFISPVVLLTDLDLIKEVLSNRSDLFLNRGLYYNRKDDPLSAHLLALEGE